MARARWLRLVVIALALGFWFLTQSLIGADGGSEA